MGTKLGQNIHDHKISDEFDYGCTLTITTGAICLWTRKIAIFDFVYTLASTNINHSVPNLFKYGHKILDEIDYGLIKPEQLELLALEVKSALE